MWGVRLGAIYGLLGMPDYGDGMQAQKITPIQASI